MIPLTVHLKQVSAILPTQFDLREVQLSPPALIIRPYYNIPMSRLLGLANETLLQIIACTDVEDIDSFSSCNRHMRLLFGPVLQLHMERKRKYSKAGFGCSNSRPRFPHAVMLLRDALENPVITRYPTKLVIGDCVDSLADWPDWSVERREEGRMEIGNAIDQCKDMISARLDDSPYIKPSHKQDWKQEIYAGDEHTTVAFMVTLFPNLRSITISDARFPSDRLDEIVSKIAKAHRKIPEIFHPLQKLTTVRLERSSLELFRASYDVLEPFVQFQSVRILAGKMVYGWQCEWGNEDENESDDGNNETSEDEDEDEDEDKDEGKNENEDDNESDDEEEEEDDCKDLDEDRNDTKVDVDHEDENEGEYEHEKIVKSGGSIARMNFKESTIDAKSFDMVLRGTKALRHFEYSYPLLTGFDVKWQPGAIFRSLLFYAGHSLVSLNLTGPKGSWDVCVCDSPYFANSPRHFQVLKRLYVQEGMFAERVDVLEPPRSANKHRWSTKIAVSRNYRMVDILPASLEELTLFPPFDCRDQIMSAFGGYSELKKNRLPRLKQITFAGRFQLDKGVKLACKKVGTSVTDFAED